MKIRKQFGSHYANCGTVTPNVPTVRIEIRTTRRPALIQTHSDGGATRREQAEQEERETLLQVRGTKSHARLHAQAQMGFLLLGLFCCSSAHQTRRSPQIDHSLRTQCASKPASLAAFPPNGRSARCSDDGAWATPLRTPEGGGGAPRCHPARCRVLEGSPFGGIETSCLSSNCRRVGEVGRQDGCV